MTNMENKENKTPTRRRKNRYRTGEDIDMLRERDSERKNKTYVPICDRHIDGA